LTIVGEEKSGNVPLLSRRRRSTDNITNASPDLATANISVVIVTTGCRVYDPNRETWDPNGCTVCNYNAMVYTLFIYFLTSFIVYGNNAVIKFSFFFLLWYFRTSHGHHSCGTSCIHTGPWWIYTIYVDYRKIYSLSVRALETGRKENIVFILRYQKVQNTCQIVW